MASPSVRAVLFDTPAPDASSTRIGPVPAPLPGRGKLLIDVACAGINFKDVMARRGDPGYATHWPFVPGLEVAGTVLAVDETVSGFGVGDRVLALTNAGGLAEHAVAEAALTVPVPDEVDLAIAAAVPGAYTTAELLLHHVGRVRETDAVAVHSASGAVGTAIATLARQAGVHNLVGIVGDASRHASAREVGYPHAFARTSDVAARVRAALQGRGADIVLDTQGTNWLSNDLDMLAPGGRVILFGNAAGEALTALPHPGELYRRNASIAGFSLEGLSREAPDAVRTAMETVLAHIHTGVVRPACTVVDGLESVPEIQQRLAEGTGRGKYVVRV